MNIGRKISTAILVSFLLLESFISIAQSDPVILNTLTAKPRTHYIEVNCELPFNNFDGDIILEKSVDGKKFIELCAITADNIDKRSFQLRDYQEVKGKNTYRVKFVNTQGKVGYSNTFTVLW